MDLDGFFCRGRQDFMPGRVGFNLLVDLAGECKCDAWWILLDYYEDYQYSTDLRGRVKRHKGKVQKKN